MTHWLLNVLLTALFLVERAKSEDLDDSEPTPIVLWHGMGDSCCNPISLGAFTGFLDGQMPGVYVKSLALGNGFIDDTLSGFFEDSNVQVAKACEMIRSDPKLANGYNAIGFSQGGQFLRAVAQRCYPSKMKNLISLGGQHQGIYGIPRCPYPNHKLCNYVRILLNKAAYWSWVQDQFVQAQYWHDPLNEEEYIKGSHFLSDINNERQINSTYIDGILSLEHLVLVKFESDTMVEPKESEWFDFYTPGQGVEITPLNESTLYTEDKLGLKKLAQRGGLVFLSAPGDHLKFSRGWFLDNILAPYLR